MAYRYRYSARKTRRSGKLPLSITLIVIGVLLYASIFWILPLFVNTVGLITSPFKTTAKSGSNVAEQATLAPPVLNIPFEATNTATMIIRGYAAPGSTVKIYLNDQLVDELKASGDGSFNTSEVVLILGLNSIYGKSVDDKNNESLPSKIIKITYDNEKPNLEVYEPEDNKSVQGERKLRVSGKTDPDAEVLVNDSRVIVKADGTFQTEVSLNDGDNAITIKASDKASNTVQLERKVTFQP